MWLWLCIIKGIAEPVRLFSTTSCQTIKASSGQLAETDFSIMINQTTFFFLQQQPLNWAYPSSTPHFLCLSLNFLPAIRRWVEIFASTIPASLCWLKSSPCLYSITFVSFLWGGWPQLTGWKYSDSATQHGWHFWVLGPQTWGQTLRQKCLLTPGDLKGPCVTHKQHGCITYVWCNWGSPCMYAWALSSVYHVTMSSFCAHMLGSP